MIRLCVGFDPREAVCFHTFCHSVITRTTADVSFIPLRGERRDGSNDFVYARFLVPHLMGYQGWAIYADGDMVCLADIAELWAMRDPWKAVHVVKHDYKTKARAKYLGAPNEDYLRKNWSSLILFNCAHYANRQLSPEYVRKHDGAHLHRFAWIPDDRIGEIPKEWNWLDTEYEPNPEAKLIHYTLGTPCFEDYQDCDHADQWKAEHWSSQRPIVESARE